MYTINDIEKKTKMKESKGQTAGLYCKMFDKKKDIYMHDKNTGLVYKFTFKPDKEDPTKFVVTGENKKKYNFVDDTNPYVISFEPMVIVKSTSKKLIYFIASDNFDFYE